MVKCLKQIIKKKEVQFSYVNTEGRGENDKVASPESKPIERCNLNESGLTRSFVAGKMTQINLYPFHVKLKDVLFVQN